VCQWRVKALLVCGNRTEIKDVTEPRTCEYVVELSSPLVCHPDSMLVFPTLTEELQDTWDELEGLREQNVVTEQVLVAASFLQWYILVYFSVDPLECKGGYSATSNNMKLVHWPLMDGLLHLVQQWTIQQYGDWYTGRWCYIWYSEEGPGVFTDE